MIRTCEKCGASSIVDESSAATHQPVCKQCGALFNDSIVTLSQTDSTGLSQSETVIANNQSGPVLTEQFFYFSYAIIAINVIVFLLMVLSGVSFISPDIQSLLKWGADFGPLAMGGEPWRLLSSMFLHFGVIHLAFNMYVLADVGPIIERLFGRMGFLVLYLLSGIGGGLASICWNPTVVSAGASGAVFGLFGGLLGILATQRNALSSDFVRQHFTSISGFLAFNILYGLVNPRIDNAAHMGGLVAGFLIAVALRPDMTKTKKWGVTQYVGTVAIIVVLALAGFAAKRRVENSPAAPKITVGTNNDIYFAGGATKEEAQKLGQALQQKGYFQGDEGAAVLLTKGAEGVLEISLVVKDGAWDDPQAIEWLKGFATDLSANVFQGKPITIHLCDGNLTPKKSIKIR